MTRSTIAGLILLILPLACIAPAIAAESTQKELGWSGTAEFSFVLTAGNSESKTLGLSGNTERTWDKGLLAIQAGALKVETTADIGVAIGTTTDFSVPEVTATTAESYYAAGKYDRNISERFFWYVAAGWLRNEFAGIEDRYTASAGLGNIWFDRRRFSFRTSYGLSNTDQRDVVQTPNVAGNYVGVLFLSNLKKKFGKKSEYGNTLLANYSLADSDNWRWNMEQWVSTSLTEKLALKVTLFWLFNNVPAFKELSLLEGDPPADQGNTVFVQLDKLDTIFSVSLVVSF